jgi:hypothetical protein
MQLESFANQDDMAEHLHTKILLSNSLGGYRLNLNYM